MLTLETMARIDVLVRGLHEITERQGKKVTCGNCFWCCKEPVQATKEEAAFMLEGLSSEELEEVKERTRVWYRMAVATGVLKDNPPFVFIYRQAKLWCPMLKDGKCMSYVRRPIGCRFHIATGDPQLCSDDVTRLKQEFTMSPPIMANAHLLSVGEKRVTVEIDLLQVWWVRNLLGVKVESSAYEKHVSYLDGETFVVEQR